MQSQLELTPTQNRIVRRNPAVRYDAVLKELRTKLSIYNWSKCDIYEICTKHKVSRSLEVSLVRLNIIERQGRKRSYEYRATPLLLKISPDELRARLQALSTDEAIPERQDSLLAGDWFRWFEGGLIVGGVLVGLIVKLI